MIRNKLNQTIQTNRLQAVFTTHPCHGLVFPGPCCGLSTARVHYLLKILEPALLHSRAKTVCLGLI